MNTDHDYHEAKTAELRLDKRGIHEMLIRCNGRILWMNLFAFYHSFQEKCAWQSSWLGWLNDNEPT